MKRIDDPYPDHEERFSRRRDRKRPHARRRSGDLLVDEASARSSADRFTDPELQLLYERGRIDTLLGELKSGKEATVYLARGPAGLLAVKVYADLQVRAFRNDGIYRSGRYIADARAAKAVAQRSAFGKQAQQDMWALHEYQILWRLHDAGLAVPRPMVGPDPIDLAEAGRTVLMEFVGDEDGAAPRLSDATLERDEAEEALRQSVAFMAGLARLGLVHGDLSGYNLLWWRGRVVAIDFPQAVARRENRQADELLERDAVNLCRSFRRFGLEPDPAEVLRRVRG